MSCLSKAAPSVSVIAAVHNGASFIEASILSILTQDFTDFEFIIVDDGSTDDSGCILDAAAARDARIRVLHRENTGLTASLKYAMTHARGIYVARQDDDDLSLPPRLSLQKQYLDAHPACAVVGCRYKSIDGNGKIIGRSNVPVSDAAIKRALVTHNVIAHSGAMFHRDKIERIGGYDTAFRTAQDYDLWCRAALHYELGNVKTVLLLRRIHDNQIGAVQSKSQLKNRDRIKRRYRHAVLCGDATVPLPLSVRLTARFFSMFESPFESDAHEQ